MITTSHVINDDCEDQSFPHTITGQSTKSITAACIGRYGSLERFYGTASTSVQPGVITVSYTDCCWVSDFRGGNWNIFTTINITSVRADTGEYNSSPETTVPLRLQLVPGCPSYQIPVTDPDNDRFECREGGPSECGIKCSYNSDRPGTITTDCILDFDAGSPIPTEGPYLVNLAIEDFDTDNNELSLVFAQFIMEFIIDWPEDLLLINPEPNNVFLDTSISNTFTISLNEDFFMPLHPATFTFVDRYTGQVFHTITTTSNGGQLTYNERNIQITPTETFSGPTYEGRHISILVQSGVATSINCRRINQPISDLDFWFVKIGKCRKCIQSYINFKQIMKFVIEPRDCF